MNKKLKKGLTTTMAAAMGLGVVIPAVPVIAAPATNGWVLTAQGWTYYKSGVKATGWILDGGKWYLLDSNGVMKTGWAKDAGSWYFLNASGAMATGWVKDTDGKWYFLKTSGAMAANVWVGNYYVGGDGAMLASTVTPDGWTVDANGAWDGHSKAADLSAATTAVAKAEASKAQADIDAATAAIAKLTVAADATALTARLDAISATLQVSSVTAINSKQLVVKFNKAVDPDTLFNSTTGIITSNISIARTVADTTDTNKNLLNVANTLGDLSADGKTLTLTLPVASNDYFSGTYVATLTEGVKTTASEALQAYTGTFTVSDTTPVSVTGLTYDVATGFKVTLSEPIKAKPTTIRVNGSDVYASASLADNNTTIVIPKPASVAAGSTASVYVGGAVDFASNLLTPYTGSAYVTNDTSAVAVSSITQVASNKLRVVFNKPIATADGSVKSAITILRNGITYSSTSYSVAKNTTVDSTGKTFDITLGSTPIVGPDFGDLYGTNVSSVGLTVVFGDGLVADYYGNTLPAASQTLTATKDVVAPTLVSSKVSTDGTTIDLKFSQSIASVDDTKLEIRKDGTAVANSVDSASVDGTDATIVHVTPGTGLVTTPGTTALAAGSYSVRLADSAVTNLNGVVSVATTTPTVTVAGTTDDLTATIANTATAPTGLNKIKVTFSEAVTEATALNPANYQLDGVALPTGTDVRFDGTATTANTVVLIDLPANFVNYGSVTAGGNSLLSVSGVQTSAGKTVVPTYNTVLVADNTPAVLQSASLVADTLVLTFNENLGTAPANIAAVLADFDITSGTNTLSAGSVTPATAVASVSGNKLTITFVTPSPTDSNWATIKAGSTIKVTTDTPALTDANGETVKDAVTVTVTK